MEKLRYADVEKRYPEALEDLKAKFPEASWSGEVFEVEGDAVNEVVLLKVGGRGFTLTRRQALDLSYGLSREAKRIDKKRKKGLRR